MTTAETTLARLSDIAVVPVIRTPSLETAERVVDWLAEAGMTTVEITLTTPGALDLIARLRRDTDLLVGAGTLRSSKDTRAAIDAGAQYLVSPAFVPGLAQAAQAAGIPSVVGALTPSEVEAVRSECANAVKIFPVNAAGGAAYIKALKSVFPELLLAPTGGITPETVADYLRAGAAFVGVGGNLVNVAAIKEGRKQVIMEAAQTALASVRQFKNEE